jgi:hypothetical protein
MYPVANGSFVDAGEATDVHGRICRRDPSARSADDDADLTFIVELLRLQRPQQDLAVPHKRVRHSHEYARVAGKVSAVLVLCVAIRVVDPDAKDLARLRHRQTELHVVHPTVGCGAGKHRAGARHCRLSTFQQGCDSGDVRQAAAEVDNSPGSCSTPSGTAFMDIAEQLHAGSNPKNWAGLSTSILRRVSASGAKR